MSRATCANIHAAALRGNLARIRELAGSARVMAVVKADAYGHGLERVARALDDADAFGVACIADGQRLRAAGVQQRIVVLSGMDEPGDLAELRRLQLEPVIHHEIQVDWLRAERPQQSPLRVWLKIDSGMHRLGFAPQQAAAVYNQLRGLSNVAPDITLMTHLANSEIGGDPDTAAQLHMFEQAVQPLAGPRSIANSAAVLGWPASRAQWLRVGGLLYGMSLQPGRQGSDHGLAPAMTLGTRLVAVNQVARGERVGYAGAWQCPEDMPVGVASIGYGDGYPRAARSGTPVLVNGRRVPLIGRVSMDLITLDLRGQPGARVGDPVTLWGQGLPIEEVAAHAGTIPYDLTCGITRRVRFVDDGS